MRNGETPSLARSVNHRLSDLICRAISSKEKRFNSVDEMKKSIEFLLTSMPEEWLEQNVNDIVCADSASEPVSLESEEVIDADIIEENVDEKAPPKTLAPEEIALKKKNIKDFWLIGVVVAVLIAAVAIGTVLLYNSGNREIYSLIESESYAVAFKEISELQEKGQNVDDLLKAYIDACMQDSEHKRVVQALPLFSETAFEDTEYFVTLCSDMMNSGREKQAESVFDFLYEKETLRSELEKLLNK